MRTCWRWTVFKLGQMLWAWFSWWNKPFPLLPVRFSWPATISGSWKGLVYCRPIPLLFSFFQPTEELIYLHLYLKLTPSQTDPTHQYTSSITVIYNTSKVLNTSSHIVWSSLVLAPISRNSYKFSRLISIHFLKKISWENLIKDQRLICL